ncbi:response regulator [Halorubrum sp. GN11_10-6_MGM]|uniref:receiver/sensor box histidine kinase n=1 Tax=Halorubrum sp. GN11_10-6_MGM TaxID=2518112 RepID=UPI0010F7CEF1|nr:ATP-binding protein [Halorubrum sp. GN11_10-6_MGM]TKX73428.1 response regulator [Halorubrum sp. GN11_10-6_MGM]
MSNVPGETIRVLSVPEIGRARSFGTEWPEAEFDVTVESNVTAAVERLRRDAVDCVVAGHDLPDGDGVELLREVRDRRPGVPFVLATASGSEQIASEAVASGVTDYVPLDPADGSDELRDRVRQAVARGRSSAGDESRDRDRRRLETLIGNLPGFVYRCRNAPGWPMELVRGESESITGYTTAELASDAVVWGEDVIHPDDRERAWETVQTAIDTDEEFEITYRIRTRDGELGWMWERGCLVESTVDGTAVLEGFITDVTERKEYEAELERRNKELESFARVVSHDLQNPLSVAKGRVELAREHCDDPNLDHAANAHERMSERIDQLLTLARNGKRVTDVEPVDLAAVVERCWSETATEDASLEVETDLTVDADRERLVQLLENLVRNAVDHGGDDVVVRVGELDSPAGFFVADNGPGIPADVRERAFETGFTTAADGTGFGLSIVSRIAEAHGWSAEAVEGADGARIEVRTEPTP